MCLPKEAEEWKRQIASTAGMKPNKTVASFGNFKASDISFTA